MDECVEDKASCSLYANCTNTVGAYTCSCAEGFTGDGKECLADDPMYLISTFDREAAEEVLNKEDSEANLNKRESLIASVTNSTSNLNATLDQAQLKQIAEIVTVAVQNTTKLSASARKEAVHASEQILVALEAVKQDAHLKPCESSDSCPLGQTCFTCPSRCGSCRATSSITTLLNVQFRESPHRVGTAVLNIEPATPRPYSVHGLSQGNLQEAGSLMGVTVSKIICESPLTLSRS